MLQFSFCEPKEKRKYLDKIDIMVHLLQYLHGMHDKIEVKRGSSSS